MWEPITSGSTTSGGPKLFPPTAGGRPRPTTVTAEALRLRQNELRRHMAEVSSPAISDSEQGPVNTFDVEHWFQQSKSAQVEVDEQDLPQQVDETVAGLKASLGETRKKLSFASPGPLEQGPLTEVEDPILRSLTASQRKSLPSLGEDPPLRSLTASQRKSLPSKGEDPPLRSLPARPRKSLRSFGEDPDAVARPGPPLRSLTASQRKSVPSLAELATGRAQKIAAQSRCMRLQGAPKIAEQSRLSSMKDEPSSGEEFALEETDWASLWAWDSPNEVGVGTPPEVESQHSLRASEASLDDEPRRMSSTEIRASLPSSRPWTPTSGMASPPRAITAPSGFSPPPSPAQTPATGKLSSLLRGGITPDGRATTGASGRATTGSSARATTASSARALTASPGRATTASSARALTASSGRAVTVSSGRAVTASSWSGNAAGRPLSPVLSSRRLTDSVYGSRWPWFTRVANIWPVGWLFLEIFIHYSSICQGLEAIWDKIPEDGQLLKFFWPDAFVPNETVLALCFWWLFMAAHSFRRLHAFFRCYFRIRPVLKGSQKWRVAVCLAARESTWLALDAADRTYAMKAMERNPNVAQSLGEVNCCFRYWCLTCYLPCFHRCFLQSHFTALNVHHLEEKQAVVTMWELFNERGTCSTFPQRGMKFVSFLFLLLNPFLGTTTYHWPETMWLWKMMSWRAVTDIVYFFAFMDAPCFTTPENIVNGRRLALPELVHGGASATTAANTSRQLSDEDKYEFVARDCAWFIDNASSATTFWSPIGNATFTKSGCSVFVDLRLDLGASLGGFYHELMGHFEDTALQGSGTATDYRFEITFRSPGGEDFLWAGAVLLNGDIAINGTDQETVLTQANPTTTGEACPDLIGAWTTDHAGLQLQSFSVLEQTGCDLQLLNSGVYDLAQYPTVMQGPTFAFFADTMHIGHIWENDTVLLYPSDFSSILTFSKAEPIECLICGFDGVTLLAENRISSTAYTCGQAQSVVDQGARSCDGWEGDFAYVDKGYEYDCCAWTNCYFTGVLFFRFLCGLCTLFSLWRKFWKYQRIWQADTGGTVTNYWGRKDFWEKWVASMEPVDWSRPLDMWAEYARLRREDIIARWNQRQRGLP